MHSLNFSGTININGTSVATKSAKLEISDLEDEGVKILEGLTKETELAVSISGQVTES